MGQNKMQVGVGENQKPVVKVIIKGIFFFIQILDMTAFSF